MTTFEEKALGYNAQSHTPLHSGSNAHKIQRQQQVGASRKYEAAVQINEGATSFRSCCAEQQVERQQQAERELQQQAQQPFWNGSGFYLKRKTYKHLFERVCDYDNLLLAFMKARKRKTKKEYVRRFEAKLRQELLQLQWELQTGIYKPSPMKTFIVHDPKTRKISASHFRDRVVHHAICNVIESIFESRFIYDTFANRKKKGTKAILQRFDVFKQKNTFALKADIKHYFDTIDHRVLFSILHRRIKDERLLCLISLILQNHTTKTPGKGMPLGNLTSQFFANVYLAELDNFIKHKLRAKYYVRYVDDFILLHKNKAQLEEWQDKIGLFLEKELKIKLHSDKTGIMPIKTGVQLVGFRVFPTHKLLKKSNLRRLKIRIRRFKETKNIKHKHLQASISGWEGYAKMANTFNLREEIRKELETLNTEVETCQSCQ